jgi:DNA gyrase subunit B
LNEYLGFFDKVDKRLRDARVTELLPKLGFSARTDFEGDKKNPPKKILQLEKQLKGLEKTNGVKEIKLQYDAEHNLWEAHFTDAQGAERKINWELASTPEYRQMISKYKQIQEFMEPPFVVETIGRAAAAAQEEEGEEPSETEREALAKAGITEKEKKAAKPAGKKKSALETVEKQSGRELFDYVLSQGKKDFNVQRYKGLGEMTASQLWETTLDPEKRTLLTVKMEDLAECETIFTTLMGEDVESRRKFIEENALDVKNLDI